MADLIKRFGQAQVEAAVPKKSKKRGRPPGTGHDDTLALAHMADLIVSGEAENPTQASWASIHLTEQHSEASAAARLQRKFRHGRSRLLKAARLRTEIVRTVGGSIVPTIDLFGAKAATEAFAQRQRELAERVQQFAAYLQEPYMQIVRRQVEAMAGYDELVRKSAELVYARPFVRTEKDDN